MPVGTIKIPDGWIQTAGIREMPLRMGTWPLKSLYFGNNNGEHIVVLGPREDGQSTRFAARAEEFDETYSHKVGVPSKAYIGGSSVLSLYFMNLALGVAITLLSICVFAAFNWPSRSSP